MDMGHDLLVAPEHACDDGGRPRYHSQPGGSTPVCKKPGLFAVSPHEDHTEYGINDGWATTNTAAIAGPVRRGTGLVGKDLEKGTLKMYDRRISLGTC